MKSKGLGHEFLEDMQDSIFSFDVPGETLLGLFNALTFVLMNAPQYLDEADECEHCLKALEALRHHVETILGSSDLYAKKKDSN